MRKHGLRGVGLALLSTCFAFALGTGTGPQVHPVDGGINLELENEVKTQTDLPPLVALTFDDGPRATTTGPLLEGLALREVPATFFLVGERIPGCEDLILEMARQGHQIGIHTYDHVIITELSRRECDLQMERTRELLRDVLGPGEYWLRPPYGLVNQRVLRWADGPLILWSVDPEDWKEKGVERIVSTVVNQVKDGDIILLHDIYDSSVEAALDIVDGLSQRGYCFVTVEQMMRLREVAPQRGVVYMSLPPGL